MNPQADPFIAVLPKLLPAYGLKVSAPLTLLSVSENWTYCAGQGAERLVLRVHRLGYHTDAEIISERAWVMALFDEGTVPTAAPVSTLDGRPITHLDVNGQRYTVSAYAFVDGSEPDVSGDLTAQFQALGGITAKLHRHAQSWTKPDGFARKTWNFDVMFGPDALWGDWRKACTHASQLDVLHTLCDELRDQLTSYGTAEDRFGLIHGDLRLANLLDDGQRLSVIDFDDCGFGWFTYDFAAAISFHECDERVGHWQDAWVDGYQSVVPLPKVHQDILPTMIMARRLLLTAWLTSRAGTDTQAAFGEGFVDGTVGLAHKYLG